MNKISKIAVFLVIAAIVSSAIYVFYKAYQPKSLRFQGEIDAQSYSVSSKIPGRIESIMVKKGGIVKEGDLVFTIASPEVNAKLKQAKAAQAAAGALAKEADKGARKEQIQAAHDEYQRAQVATQLLEKTFKRIEALYKDGVVSQQKRDEVYTKYKAAQYQENAAKQLYVMAKEGAREEQKEAAKEQERVYAGKVDEVQSYLEETKQYAFNHGEVSQILIHPGELAPTGFPVVTLIDIEDSWARFNVREDLLKYFKKGSVVDLEIPALSQNSYKFKVTYISVMGEYATWRAAEAGKGFDLKSFEVELRPLEHIDGLRVGMTVLAEF
jgi:HlyD family secretion protein